MPYRGLLASRKRTKLFCSYRCPLRASADDAQQRYDYYKMIFHDLLLYNKLAGHFNLPIYELLIYKPILVQNGKHEFRPEVIILQIQRSLEALLCLSLVSETEITESHHAVSHCIDSLDCKA